MAEAGDAVVWRGLLRRRVVHEGGYRPGPGKTVKLARREVRGVPLRGLPPSITPITINGGSIDLATTLSTQWAPVVAADGTTGMAGDPSNVPYVFTSSSSADTLGVVNLTQLTPAAWYMLVEVEGACGLSAAHRPMGVPGARAVGIGGRLAST